MEIRVKHFSELSIYELHEIIRARVDVFVAEQSCPYSELDGLDTEAYHVWLEEDGELWAYLRVLKPGVRFNEASIGRVLSLRRRCGLGSAVLAAGLRVAEEKFGAACVRIEAQTYARKMYEKAGFRQVSGEFLEDGIPHIEMLWVKESRDDA